MAQQKQTNNNDYDRNPPDVERATDSQSVTVTVTVTVTVRVDKTTYK
jgi:hypothetical protein